MGAVIEVGSAVDMVGYLWLVVVANVSVMAVDTISIGVSPRIGRV